MEKYRFDPKVLASMEASPVPFAIYQFIDRRVVTLMLSAGFCELFGFDDRAEAYYVMDNDMYRSAHADDMARIADAAFRFATEGGEYNVVYRTRNSEAEDYVVVHAQGQHVYTETGVRLAYIWYTNEGMFSDEAGELKDDLNRSFNQMLREGSMVHQHHYDSITGLPNMTYFFELAEAGIKNLWMSGKPPAILFLDLCGMKSFNNKWGFSEGDKLIRDFGHLLGQRFGNEQCARLGQDHFAAFVSAEGLEEKLRELFAAAVALNDGNALPVRAGIYLVGKDCVEIGKACDRAKMACDVNRKLFQSEFNYFDDTMLAEAEKRQYIIDNLDRALAEKWIKVYFQPIVRAANGKVCDEEALSRWIDPERGYMTPSDFIPALEEAKLIYKLDLYVVDEILAKMKRQADAGLYVVPESVNLSRADFDSCDIVEEICRRVDAAGIERAKLTIEVTESVVGSSFEFMKAQVARFQSLGFQVWMDDFGSGYSSLDVLQSIHFDVIKFDMRFMQQFDSGDEGKIILTELVKMAIGLGVETVCEGVERADQVEFLREIGCTKLQGFYYCKAIAPEEIIERNRKGIQIGFENPEESEYYTTIGRINLYDMAVLAGEEDESLRRYFDTLPMAIMEVNGSVAKYTRCNKSYRDFMQRAFGMIFVAEEFDYGAMPDGPGASFVSAVLRCSRDGNRAIVDEKIGEDTTVHSFVRRVAVNPVTGTAAVAVAVLAVVKESENAGTTYASIARALSADYINLYYVDMETEKFIEYSSDAIREDLAVERHGADFFARSRDDAMKRLYREDRAFFVETFTHENVTRALDTQGTFRLTYRLMVDGEPTYVNMKAVRMQTGSRYIIIGVSNVDAQMKHKEALERIQAERVTFERITALSGDYIGIYTVDPKTDQYMEYSATREYEGLGLAKEGEDFFNAARRDSAKTIFPDDLGLFNAMFTKENVMRDIERTGLFVLRYRLVIKGEPVYVNLKAAMVEEQDGPRLIIGVNNVDVQVRRELDYERKLSAARSRANLDGLTGVKNKSAYEDMSETLSRQIEGGQPVKYAIALCGVKDLERTNETLGRDAGDRLIREACAVICDVFNHSPVFRVAGDQFAVIAQGRDYECIDALVAALEDINEKNRQAGRAVIACGMARYDGTGSVASVFERADALCRADE